MGSIRNTRAQAGIAIVEFVIAMPLLLFLMLATAELGRAFYQYTALEKAAENGARYLVDFALDGTGTVGVTDAQRAEVRNLVMYGDIQGDSGTLLVPALVAENIDAQPAADLERHIRVTVSYAYQPLLPDFPVIGWLAQQVAINSPLRVQVTMRALL